uniref:C-C motif chemokine 19a.1 n=1 Tax=Scatophagus argus TaxID=75038 RepID=UPI001ED8142C|nr:C-C motif chemokine 19a.1 [Scatophagus argus]
MAPWVDAKLFFCILFITYSCTVILAQLPMDCCLQAKNQTVEKFVVANYRRQSNGEGCNVDATILVTRRKVNLCVPADEPWVHEVVKHVKWLRAYCKRHNYKGKRCFGVDPE